MALIDRVFAIEGLKRAWPCDGAIAVEVVDRYGRLRAGRFADSGLVLSPYACASSSSTPSGPARAPGWRAGGTTPCPTPRAPPSKPPAQERALP